MAVDYLHRLIVTGPHQAVRVFRRRMHRQYPRSVAGETWTEIVPFSFAALYEAAPSARRVEREIPCDPYELSAWPVRRVGDRRAELRYQFQTRNLEMVPLLRALSRATPSLTFTLVTFCFDDSSVESYRLWRGRTRKWVMPSDRQEGHWHRARKKFRLAGDQVYDNDDAEFWAEEEMRREALRHWDRAGNASRRRYGWWNRIRWRDLSTEREIAVIETIEAMTRTDRTRRAAKSGRRTGGRKRRRRRR